MSMPLGCLDQLDLTFRQRFALGVRIYFWNLGRILPVVLAIWVPGNLLYSYLLLYTGQPRLLG